MTYNDWKGQTKVLKPEYIIEESPYVRKVVLPINKTTDFIKTTDFTKTIKTINIIKKPNYILYIIVIGIGIYLYRRLK